MKKRLLYCFIACGLLSCVDIDDLGTPEGYKEKFISTEEVTVKVASTGAHQIYYTNPFATDSMPEPIVSMTGPASVKMNVPNGVETLFVVGNGQLKSMAKAKSVSVNTMCTYEAAQYAYNVFFPLLKYNYAREELFECTDFSITKDIDVDIPLRYIGDGNLFAFGQSSNTVIKYYNKVWAYVYPTSKRENLTIDDCVFYGLLQDTDTVVQPIDLAVFKQIYAREVDNYGLPKTNPTQYEYEIYHNQDEANDLLNGRYNKVIFPAGALKAGYSLGFTMRGNGFRPQFSTPNLNVSTGRFAYLNKSLKVDNSGTKFLVNKPVTHGFVQRVENTDTYVVGMENKPIVFSNYDGDFNDMMLSVEMPNEFISAVPELTPPVIENYYIDAGMYLFEDNYPGEGDFDFNDVVVEYRYKKFLNSDRVEANFKLQAYGCDFINDFLVNGVEVFTDLQGFENVIIYEGVLDEKDMVFNTTAALEPSLVTSYGVITRDEFHTDDFPYVLIIPSNDAKECDFLWCKECIRLDAAYNFKSPRAHNWYMKPRDLDLVVIR